MIDPEITKAIEVIESQMADKDQRIAKLEQTLKTWGDKMDSAKAIAAQLYAVLEKGLGK